MIIECDRCFFMKEYGDSDTEDGHYKRLVDFILAAKTDGWTIISEPGGHFEMWCPGCSDIFDKKGGLR